MHEPEWVEWDAEAFLQRFDARVQPILDRGVRQERVLRLTEEIVRSARHTPPRSVQRSVMHGDFKLRHIWASGSGIQAFDMGNSSVGDCQREVAAFIVELMVLSLWKPWFTTSRICEYCESFLQGYYGEAEVPTTLKFYVVEYLLKKWNRRLRAWSRTGGMRVLHGLLEYGRIGRMVEELYMNRWFHTRAVGLSTGAESWLSAMSDTRKRA